MRTGDVAEAEFVRPVTSEQRKQLTHACFRMFEHGRKLAAEARAGRELTTEEHRLTLFTRSCRDMLIRMLDELHYRKGWCNPSYETLMRWTGLGRRAVHYSIQRLRDLGVVEWIRRYIYTRDQETGARSEQTSNLYRAQLPAWIGKMIGLFAPVPVDEDQRRSEALEQHAQMLAAAGAVERRRLMPTDIAQRAALILAAERSSERQRQETLTRECNQCTPPHPILKSIKRDQWNDPSRVMPTPDGASERPRWSQKRHPKS
ncbi:helix-turn-helix domain-containing protein [Sphingobium sp. B11D3A]|uniref:helix-turn-helix domain-containing protein n=1 Tax=Sphingobium sp. B11D3A TaxID=2940574 RepID=UPI0022242E40|nr:helix-turn-helix domain-containing protein [Sphingobium sp. B11D3A]MCW2393581.1 biotin operon repressor [Sphingobium sp. B11D3A]